MDTGKLSLLSDNLDALSETASSSTQLVTDFSGTALFTSSSFYGRVLKILYFLLDFFYDAQDAQEKNVLQTLSKVRTEFAQFLDEIDRQNAPLSTDGRPFVTCDLPEVDQQILSIGTNCLFLTSHEMLFNPRQALGSLQQHFMQKTDAFFLDVRDIERLERFTKRFAQIALRTLLELEYPVANFVELIENRPLQRQDIAALNEWTQGVEENKDHLSVFLMHTALTSLVEQHYAHLNVAVSLPEAVSILEWRLFQGRCSMLGEDDVKHRKWIAETIYPGASVVVNQRRMRVGDRVELALLEDYHAELYELPEEETKLLFVGRNPAILGMWHEACQSTARACRPLDVLEKDPFLRFYVVERVNLTLADVEWKTTNKSIHEEDIPLADEIIDFLAWLDVNRVYTPKGLHPNRIFVQAIDNRMRLRTILPFDDPGPHNFIAIEQFAHLCARGNRWMLRHMMHESHLIEHEMATLFYEVAERMLLGTFPAVSVQNMLNRQNISDPELISTIETMVENLKACHAAIWGTLQTRLINDEQLSKLKEYVAQDLVAEARFWGYSSCVDPFLMVPEGKRQQELKILQAHPEIFFPQ